MVTALKTDPEVFYRINKLEGTPPHEEVPIAGQTAARRGT
jgi:hypothetical protein